VLLPLTTWRGSYLQQGCGGLCGHVGVSLTDPSRTSGYQAPFAPLRDGEMVVAADDQGHESPTNQDALWAEHDLQLRVVFGYSSEHSLAVTAKALIRAFYGRDPLHSYFDGVSDGGHQALNLAQRYPEDFDGIIAGAPALNWAALLGLLETWQVRANVDEQGGQVLTSEKLPALHAAVMAACANASGYIEDPRECTFDPGTLLCPTGVDDAGCLTAAQVETVRKLYRGPTGPAGRNLYDGGQPYGSELAWNAWLVRPAGDPGWPGNTFGPPLGLNYLKYMAFWYNPPEDYDYADVPYTSYFHDRLQRLGGIYNATNPDLSAFRARGGKIILYHGWADEGVPPFATVNYYEAVAERMGAAETQTFSRLYMIPGLYHCPCGQPVDGDPATVVDMMTPLTDWVERGIAPETLQLPVTSQTTGQPVENIPVAPFDPLAAAPVTQGLNSNYDYVGKESVYMPRNQLWCEQVGPTLRCTRRG
jgi:pimeloyl-ACP methyl ester carboxylesterase